MVTGSGKITYSVGMLVSYVFPVYNEAEGIADFHQAVLDAVEPLAGTYDLEFVYVNDGSTDESLATLTGIADRDDRVVVVDFSRNYGHQLAITAGIDFAHGDAVITMDSDLQDPPAVSVDLVRRWEQGADVVYAQRRSRQDPPLKRLTAHLYYRTLLRLSAVAIPPDTGDFRLLSRRAADALREYREASRYVRGMVADVGFRQEAVVFDRDPRTTGRTSYTWPRMLRLAADGIIGFSTRPLQFILRTGVVIAGFSMAVLLYVLGVRLFSPDTAVPGWAFIATGVFFLGGIQIAILGVLGAYIGRIYVESKGRPLYIVRRVIGKAAPWA